MFNEAGKKIQGFVRFLFVISIILLIMCCIATYFGAMISIQSSTNNSSVAQGVGIFLAVIIFILGFLYLWFYYLLVFAFGKIAEDVEGQKELTKKLIDAVSGCKGHESAETTDAM